MAFNFTNHLILEDDQIRIEPLLMDHLPHLQPIAQQHPELLRYSTSRFGGQGNLETYMNDALSMRTKEERYPFVIFDKMTNRYAGSTSFCHVSNADKRIEIGWTWLSPDFQQSGLNRQAKFLLLQFVFEHLRFERVALVTDSRNTQSRKAIEGIGATYEGKLRSHTLMPDGFRRDTVFYSILKTEWPVLRQTVFQPQTS